MGFRHTDTPTPHEIDTPGTWPPQVRDRPPPGSRRPHRKAPAQESRLAVRPSETEDTMQSSTTHAKADHAEADAWGDVETAVYHYAELRQVHSTKASEALNDLFNSLRPSLA